jgi:hypothetical protein
LVLLATGFTGRFTSSHKRHHACTELFEAVPVSTGRMGVVYSLVVRVVEQFWLEQQTTASTWEEPAPD